MIKCFDMLIGEVEKIIGYSFKNHKLLETALTHSSYANDFRGARERERKA